MKFGKLVLILLPALSAFVAISVLHPADGAPPKFTPKIIPLGGDPFDPVFAIMTTPRGSDSTGCRGCHIRPQPGFGPWFGDDRDTVLATLETGVTPDGEVLDPPPVQGGRSGILGNLLHFGSMPLGGTPWTDDQLAILDQWLITYETP